jgi:hypothetical protein
MHSDYTINDAYHDGFECGIAYILRYAMENRDWQLTDRDIVALGEHLWNHKPWHDSNVWTEMVYKASR